MRNISIREYIQSVDVSKYSALEHLLPKDTFGMYQMDVRSMTYDDVKGVMRTLSKFQNWNDAKDIFETCFKITEDEFFDGAIVDYFHARNYIIKTFTDLIDKEVKLLNSISKDSVLWDAAGGKRLNKFGDIMPLTQLGKIYGIYPFELKDMKYFEILTLLHKETIEVDVNKRFNELKYGHS